MLSRRIGLLLLNRAAWKQIEITYFSISVVSALLIVRRNHPFSFSFVGFIEEERICQIWYYWNAVCSLFLFFFFIFVHRIPRALCEREKREKEEAATNARLCKFMLLHTYNHCVWNKKKKPNQCVSESGWVSEWVNEVNGSDSHLCGWLIVWVSVWSGEWRTDRQTDRQIERER